MSEKEYQQLVERMLGNVASLTISSDTGIAALQQASHLVAQEPIGLTLSGRSAQRISTCEVNA